MDCNFPFLIRRYSTFRNDLPSLVWQRYFTKASSAPVVIRSRSKCPMKSICVSQHRALKVLLLMWSSPAAIVKGEVIGEQAIHYPLAPSLSSPRLRTTSGLPPRSSSSTLPMRWHLPIPGRLTAPTSAQASVASRFLCDTAILVIVRSPFHDVV